MKNPFQYKITKNGKVLIYRNHKLIKIVKGKWSQDFINSCQGLDDESIQLSLAKVTGHYKHGNEKAKE